MNNSMVLFLVLVVWPLSALTLAAFVVRAGKAKRRRAHLRLIR